MIRTTTPLTQTRERTTVPIHVPGLWADPWLTGVDAGVVDNCRNVLVSVPNLQAGGVWVGSGGVKSATICVQLTQAQET